MISSTLKIKKNKCTRWITIKVILNLNLFLIRYRSASLPRSFLKKPAIQSTVCNNNR